jgi:SAM-dependent methyltransferase
MEKNMNIKIYNHLLEKLSDCFALEKYQGIQDSFDKETIVDQLPWTPKRWQNFQEQINQTFDLDVNYTGSLQDIVDDIDEKYKTRFWGEGVWQPRTNQFQYTGWQIAEEINKRNPAAVLDVGCGYNQFKSQIANLTGIDKYNNNADFMVGIMEYNVPEKYDAIIVFGSINFGTYTDIGEQFAKVFSLLAPGGRIYVRANPGISHKNGPWIDIFAYDFETADKIARENLARMVTFKKDNGDRLYFVYEK